MQPRWSHTMVIKRWEKKKKNVEGWQWRYSEVILYASYAPMVVGACKHLSENNYQRSMGEVKVTLMKVRESSTTVLPTHRKLRGAGNWIAIVFFKWHSAPLLRRRLGSLTEINSVRCGESDTHAIFNFDRFLSHNRTANRTHNSCTHVAASRRRRIAMWMEGIDREKKERERQRERKKKRRKRGGRGGGEADKRVERVRKGGRKGSEPASETWIYCTAKTKLGWG